MNSKEAFLRQNMDRLWGERTYLCGYLGGLAGRRAPRRCSLAGG